MNVSARCDKGATTMAKIIIKDLDDTRDLTKEERQAQRGGRTLASRWEAELVTLEAVDRLGNFEIQSSIAHYNQSQQVSSALQKKRDTTADSVLHKIS